MSDPLSQAKLLLREVTLVLAAEAIAKFEERLPVKLSYMEQEIYRCAFLEGLATDVHRADPSVWARAEFNLRQKVKSNEHPTIPELTPTGAAAQRGDSSNQGTSCSTDEQR